MRKLIGILFFLFLFSFYLSVAFAHEAYVLNNEQFTQGLKEFSANPLAPLFDPSKIQISIIITVIVVLVYLVNVLFSTTKNAAFLDKKIKKISVIGPFLIRLAVGASLFIGAQSDALFAPELSISFLPFSETLEIIITITSIMIFLGIFTEVAAIFALCIFTLATFFYGQYMITYANYLGEIIVLILFGSRFLSIDSILFRKKLFISKLERFKHLEVPIVRILYGIALIYAAYSIKFLHQSIPMMVYDEYSLKQVFNASAEYISAGAGLTELTIGLFIFVGFAQRLTVTIMLIFLTLSLIYFKELVWPHLILFGIAISLIINSGDKLTLDYYFIPWIRKRIQILKSIAKK